jgi:di/tricarboxylate transporter
MSQRLLPAHAPLPNLLGIGNHNAYLSEFVVTSESSVGGKPAGQVCDRIATMGRHGPAQTGRQHRRIANPQRQHAAPGGEKDAIELLQVIRAPKAYRAEEAQRLTLQAGDVLTVAGTPKQITLFAENNGLELMSVLEDGERMPMGDVEHKVVEAVVLPSSSYRRRRIGDLDLNRLYGVKIMGLQHRGRQMVSGLRETRLAAGDVLLLQGRPEDLRLAAERGAFMLVEGADAAILRTTKNRVALFIMLGVVLLAALTDIPIVILAMAGAALMILTKCLRTDEALRSIDAGTIFLLAGTIPLGLAMETTGLAQLMVDGLVAALGHASPVIFLSVFYLLTNLLTQLLSNNAVAVLLVPIALNLSVTLGVDPKPLLMAVAFAASASFMTPMGYQTNAIVMGPGGYTVRDYLRIGVPLSLIMWLLASLLIPVIWPL